MNKIINNLVDIQNTYSELINDILFNDLNNPVNRGCNDLTKNDIQKINIYRKNIYYICEAISNLDKIEEVLKHE